MITVPEAVKKIIDRSRYLSEAMSKGIINNSSLTRYIKSEVEEMTFKKVSNSSIVMALNRLEKDYSPKYVTSNLFKTPPTLNVFSNLTMVVANKNSDFNFKKNPKSIFFRSESRYETVFIVSQDLASQIKEPSFK